MENNSVEIDDNDLVNQTAFNAFGIKYLYPWQRLVIENILEANEYLKLYETLSSKEKIAFEEENQDSFCKGKQIVLLPTGAGKSLCFQIPALLLDGPTLVIYPLLALMSDQKRRMDEGNLYSVIFKGGMTKNEQEENFKKIKNKTNIILANPEILQNEELLNRLASCNIKHITIDEAHCVSEWGDSFRPSYLNLGKVIKKINPPLVTAFTATASPEVLTRISSILFDGEVHLVRSESDRQNIHYFVRKTAAKSKEVAILSKTEVKPMIIFCGTRIKAEEIAEELNMIHGQNKVKFYHAGLSREEKSIVEKWFYDSDEGILCATCAYGMGVDKKNIRTVIHLEAPTTVEAYVQEAGRGGRDGNISKAILLWSLDDHINFSAFPDKSRKSLIKLFAETNDCRRQIILDALGGEKAVCSGCDLCFSKLNKNVKPDIVDWKLAFELIKKRKNFYTKSEIQNDLILEMNKNARNITHLNIWNHSDTAEIIRQLESSGKIKENTLFWKRRLMINNHRKDLCDI